MSSVKGTVTIDLKDYEALIKSSDTLLKIVTLVRELEITYPEPPVSMDGMVSIHGNLDPFINHKHDEREVRKILASVVRSIK